LTKYNPADGSYYIETLTAQLAEKALVLFKDIEANGGFLKQLNEGVIKEKSRKVPTKNKSSGKEILWELINTQTRRQNETRFRIVSFVKVKPRKPYPIIEKKLKSRTRTTGFRTIASNCNPSI
jgi:methylmalonyl-CoA mutase